MQWNLSDLAEETRYRTRGGLDVLRRTRPIDGDAAVAELAVALDRRRGALFSSGIDYPGRYSRYDFGFVDPPLVLETVGRAIRLTALAERGLPLLDFAAAALPPDTGLPSAARSRMCQAFMASVCPPWDQNQLKYSPSTRNRYSISPPRPSSAWRCWVRAE